MKTYTDGDLTVTYDDSPEAMERVGRILLDWFIQEHMFSGESIHQCDVTYEAAPGLLTKAAEEGFRFQPKWSL